jgi:arginine repressor
MIRLFLKRLILKNKELIFNEAQQIQGFLQLLFKQRNTDTKWQKEEKQQLKSHLKRLSLYVPILIIFTLPGGALLLPILAEILDRRKKRRIVSTP